MFTRIPFLTLIASLVCSLFAQTGSAASLQSRIEWYSESFMNRPYLIDPLGEGEGALIDKDPRIRYDGFDCTTYVETVLALARSLETSQVLPEMDKIRYQNGQVGFLQRNHFTSLDWVPNGIRQGIFKDITAEVAQEHLQISRTLIDKAAWAQMWSLERVNVSLDPVEQKQRLEKAQASAQSLPQQMAEVPFVPKEVVAAGGDILKRIPSGAIINIVRPQWDLREAIGTFLDVSHQGFAIRVGDVLYFRHASQGKYVMQEPLEQYMARMLTVRSIGGIQILQP